MTTADYLILIIALALVSGVIYIYLKRRSSANSSISTDDGAISFAPSSISNADTEIEEGLEGYILSGNVGTLTSSELSEEDRADADLRLKIAAEGASSANDQAEYLDELQDAAAGLARLMHSSEAEWVSEIVDTEVNLHELIDEDVKEDVSEETVEFVESAAQEVVEDDLVEEEPVAEYSTEDEAVESEALTEAEVTEAVVEEVPAITAVESVLGEEVVEQIGRIDSELDALEELVASIELSLEEFSELGLDEDLVSEESIPEAA